MEFAFFLTAERFSELLGAAHIFEVVFAYYSVVYVTFRSSVLGNFGFRGKKYYSNKLCLNHQKKLACMICDNDLTHKT